MVAGESGVSDVLCVDVFTEAADQLDEMALGVCNAGVVSVPVARGAAVRALAEGGVVS